MARPSGGFRAFVALAKLEAWRVRPLVLGDMGLGQVPGGWEACFGVSVLESRF